MQPSIQLANTGSNVLRTFTYHLLGVPCWRRRGISVAAMFRCDPGDIGRAFTERDPFFIAYGIEGAGAQGLVAEKLLLLKGSPAGGGIQ